MHLETPRFRAWLDADRAAQAAEHELHELMLRARVDGAFARVTDQAALAQRLRAMAHGLFDGAMREMTELAESLHHRRVLKGGVVRPGHASASAVPRTEAAEVALAQSRRGEGSAA